MKRVPAFVFAALLLSWPAFYNGYPLFFSDSMSYLNNGRRLARALLLRQFAYSYGERSLTYPLGILPLHWNVTAWPVVALNAMMTAYVLWLVVRSLLPGRTLTKFLVLVLSISALTSASWFVAWIMPDIFGPLSYLAIYLLVFVSEDLSPAERFILILFTWWGVASHITHLARAAGLCLFLIAVLALQGRATAQRMRNIGGAAVIILTAAAATMALNFYLYGEPSLGGRRPPFLMARIIADGPGRWYLRQHCGGIRLAICDHVSQLPDNASIFLWAEGGIWNGSTREQQNQLRRDEMPVVVGAVRAYPRQQLRISAANFWHQVNAFGVSGFDPNAWILERVDKVLKGARTRYLQTRQARQSLHEGFFTSVQRWTVMASLVVVAARIFAVRSSLPDRLAGLTAIIFFVLVANAAVTGVLSNVEDRYQARVIWLLPLLAGIFLLSTPFQKFTNVLRERFLRYHVLSTR